MPFAAAIAGGKTVHTLLSGPAAGAQASAYLARDDAKRGLVTLDMGGTSADIAFIEGGAPLEVTEGVISRRQIDVPALDMTTISAGGGSIAAVDGGVPHRRAAQRRRRSGPGLLRPRRHAADRDRCRPRVRLPQSGLFPRRRAEARCRAPRRRPCSATSPSR